MTQYKPYTPDWHRRRRLTEVLSDYFEDGVDPADIAEEVVDVLKEEIEYYSGKAERMETMLKHLHSISK
jgi:hypothetical protein